MSLTSPDAKAVARAIDDLTTQVRRLADAQQTPADGQSTTPDDGPCAQHPHAPVIGGHCGGCTMYPADMRPAPAADEDTRRINRRRNSILNLLDRHGTLTPEERALLRNHVVDEGLEHDTARAKAGDLAETYKQERRRGDALAEERNEAWADLKRAHKASSDLAEKIREQREFLDRARAELEQAQAAIERVRNLHQPRTYSGQTICGACSDYDPSTDSTDSAPVPYDQCSTLRALDGTEQPTTEA